MKNNKEMHMSNSELELQRTGRNKSTQINHTYINGGEYRKKFDSLSDSKELNRLLYQLSKKMLEHRAGSEFEDMYWVDIDTFEVVAEEITSQIKKKIIYSDATKKVINEYKNAPDKCLITLHTHPSSFPPSIDDFNSNFTNQYNIGLVICHDGKVFVYSAEEQISELYYELEVAKYVNEGYNNYEAMCMVLSDLQESHEIIFKEVMDHGNGK